MTTARTWQYGYMEMKARLPKGKGTWPAFWMLPEHMETVADGEIDIMEHVGYDPGVIHFSTHTGAYNPANGTTRSGTKKISDADSEFHTYGVEWTEDYVAGYIDGQLYYTFVNDKKDDKNTWPYNIPFLLKLNLAIGGSWGGYEGIDDACFPATYEIDYVRVYQRVAK